MKKTHPFEIGKKPCDTLKDCLTSYTKKQLCMLTEKMSLDKSTKINSLKKDALVAQLEPKILDSVSSIYRFLPIEFFIVIAAISKETVEEKKHSMKISSHSKRLSVKTARTLSCLTDAWFRAKSRQINAGSSLMSTGEEEILNRNGIQTKGWF